MKHENDRLQNQLKEEVRGAYGEAGLLLATTLVRAFSQGFAKSIKEGKEKSIDNSGFQFEALGNVVKMLASDLKKKPKGLTYDKWNDLITFENGGNTIKLTGGYSPYEDLLYQLMESFHAEFMEQGDDGYYLGRELYNKSLTGVLRGVRQVYK